MSRSFGAQRQFSQSAELASLIVHTYENSRIATNLSRGMYSTILLNASSRTEGRRNRRRSKKDQLKTSHVHDKDSGEAHRLRSRLACNSRLPVGKGRITQVSMEIGEPFRYCQDGRRSSYIAREAKSLPNIIWAG